MAAGRCPIHSHLSPHTYFLHQQTTMAHTGCVFDRGQQYQHCPWQRSSTVGCLSLTKVNNTRMSLTEVNNTRVSLTEVNNTRMPLTEVNDTSNDLDRGQRHQGVLPSQRSITPVCPWQRSITPEWPWQRSITPAMSLTEVNNDQFRKIRLLIFIG